MTPQTDTSFLAGGGELGALIRSKDWSRTGLGEPDSWPQSLRTSVSVCLASRFPIFLWWGEGMTTIYNDAYIPVFAGKHPWALGEPAWDVWREIWDIIGPLAMGVMEHGESSWSQDQLLHLERSGYPEECYFDFAYSPIREESGGIGGLFAVVSETTPKILGARRLGTLSEIAARTRGLQEVAGAAQMAVAALDTARRDLPFALLYGREPAEPPALLATTGLTAGQERLLQRRGLPPDEWRADLEAVLSGAGERIVGPSSLALRDDAGRPVPNAAVILPLGDAGAGDPTMALVCGISRHRALDDDLRRFCRLAGTAIATSIADVQSLEMERARAHALAELDRAKTEFFSNVSHEFRTPLTLMLAPLEDAVGGPDPPPELQMAHRNALRLLKHVNSLLDFSRLQAGRAHADRRPLDVAPISAELASVFRSAVERAGLTLAIDLPPEPLTVLVDPAHWEQIILNLLSNALKFTFTGGIVVRLARDGGEALVEVTDTGVGIATGELPRLFERFHRISGVEARSHEGSGIGLALVQELVELQGGTIAATSRRGIGTTFTIRLPIAEAVPEARATVVSERAEAFVSEALRWTDPDPMDGPAAAPIEDDRTPAAAAPPPAAPRVLVVDDNADMRAYLAHLLAPRYEVLLAKDGRAALELLRAHGADLVLSDVMMPRLDGLGLIAEVRADPALASVPLVLLSARAGEEASVEGLDAGADDYVVKPFTARELLARVGSNLALGAMRNREAALAHEHTQRLEELLTREHHIAETLQRSLLPSTLAQDHFIRLAARYLPATEALEVGGDFYDTLVLDDGRMLLLIGDVAGHGLPAAALMGRLRAAILGLALDDPDPATLLAQLNELSLRSPEAAMTTALCVLLDADGEGATYASAGHPPAFACAAGTTIALDEALGPPLGIRRMTRYRSARVRLPAASTLVMYTDGLIERRGESIDRGIERLRARMTQLAGDAVHADGIADALLTSETTERVLRDDVALLVAVIGRPQAELDLDLRAGPGDLTLLRRTLRRWLDAQRLAPDVAYDVLLAVHEAASNVVEHAYGLGGGRLHLVASRDDDAVRVTLRDEGRWRPERPRQVGRGFLLMRAAMDEVEVSATDGGVTVRMLKRSPALA